MFIMANNMNSGLIFDLDGTLWNTNPVCCKAWNTALRNLSENIKITTKMIDSVTGKPMEEGIKILIPELSRKFVNLKSIFITYEQKLIPKSKPYIYKGVRQGLKKLSEHFSLFIISNCEEWYLKHFLEYSGLKNIITDYDCAGMSNHDKEVMIKYMVKKHGLEKAIYIGDTKSDSEAAKKAQIDFIQMTYGFDKPINNSRKFGSINELVNALLK